MSRLDLFSLPSLVGRSSLSSLSGMSRPFGMSGPSSPFAQSFMLDALLAGTGIAAACGIVGYFLVLRAQVFTGDAMSHVAFTGAMAALAFGVNLRLGLFGACVAVALLLGALGRRARADDVVIGNVFAWILGLGVFFLTLFTTHGSARNGTASTRVLWGSIFGLTAGPARLSALMGLGIVMVVVLMARPLLFASVDEAVAAARGVPVRLLGYAFLAVVGATAAQATQAVGALLLLGLLASPAGAAMLLTDRPYRAMLLSVSLAVGEVWCGLLLAYAAPRVPPSFTIVAVSASTYVLVFFITRTRRGGGTLSPRQAVYPIP